MGKGAYGKVHEIRKISAPNEHFACKILRKGFHVDDNVLYTPTERYILQNEVDILRTLNGDHHNLTLLEVYESRSLIYIITEYCELDLFEYVTTCFGGSSNIRLMDMSRIAYQLFDAIDYCVKNGIIHRGMLH